MANNEIRLQKFLAEQGVASRRKSEELIKAGKVKVNGHIAQIGMKVNPRKDSVTVGKQKIVSQRKRKMIYVMLYKPRGYVTTVSDELGRKTVMDLLPDFGDRIYPVGRLDKDSEGLLILTNDGSFTNCMTHPSHEYAKVYRVTVRPAVNDTILNNLRNGIEIDGRMTAPADLKVLETQENRTVVEVTIYEGRNRQIRKMFEALGIEVARLKRTKVGNLKLGMLKQGAYRHLTEDEVSSLYELAGK